MKSRRNFLAGVAILATLPMFSAAALAQKVELRLAHVNQPTIEAHKVAVEVAERIAKRSDGRITIKLFPGGMLGTTTDMLEQASQGEPIITFTDAAYLASFGVPEMGVVGGPFIVENNEEAERLAFSPLMKGWYDKLAEKAKIRVLALNWFDGARHMIGSKPYPTPADLKGVKVRVPPVPTWQKTFEPLGVTRRGDVHALDRRVRERAADHEGPDHARQREVVDVAGLAREELLVLPAGDRLADVDAGLGLGGGHLPSSQAAAAFTALTMFW